MSNRKSNQLSLKARTSHWLVAIKLAAKKKMKFAISLSLYLFSSIRLINIIRDLFYVYLNRFEFHFLQLQLHLIKINKICFFMHNGRVPGIAKKTRWQFKA